jgi:phage shock protein A
LIHRKRTSLVCSPGREFDDEKKDEDRAVSFFMKASKYLSAAANNALDEHADPKIQIEQAVQEAQRRHGELVEHAAAVIGNVRQIEAQLARATEQSDRLQADARQALQLADQVRATDPAKAAGYEATAQSLAGELITAEQAVTTLKTEHDQAVTAAEQAKQLVDTDTTHLNQVLNQRAQLLTQLQAAQMQETVSKNLALTSDLAAPGDVPTLDAVRDKIEARYATAMGATELAQDSTEGRLAEVEQAGADQAAAARLEQIRASLTSGPAALPG